MVYVVVDKGGISIYFSCQGISDTEDSDVRGWIAADVGEVTPSDMLFSLISHFGFLHSCMALTKTCRQINK